MKACFPLGAEGGKNKFNCTQNLPQCFHPAFYQLSPFSVTLFHCLFSPRSVTSFISFTVLSLLLFSFIFIHSSTFLSFLPFVLIYLLLCLLWRSPPPFVFFTLYTSACFPQFSAPRCANLVML